MKDTAGTEEQIRELMLKKRIGAYVGIDPTAPSLHVGHLITLMPLFWMYIHGFKAVSVLGGATAKVGDPTDRLQSRKPMKRADMTMNITKMHYQLKRIWLNVEAQGRRYGYEKEKRVWSRAVLNNSQWYNTVPFIEVVARLFKGMRLGPMLSRDTVKRRMETGEGMGLDEFVYPLMQAWDWWYLFRKQGVLMQIGGSDQYGNIVAGVDSVKYMRDHEVNDSEKVPSDFLHTPVGFTVPLLTDSAGVKFGKSADNAIWLDPFKTSSFDLYGYFVRRPDTEIEKLLKLLTFFPMETIKDLMAKHEENPSKRIPHHALAFEVLSLVHGFQEATNTQNQHLGLYARKKIDPEEERMSLNEGALTSDRALNFQIDIKLPKSLVLGKHISRILYAAGLADSVTDGSRLTQQQGAYIGGSPGQPAATNVGMRYDQLMFTPVKSWFTQDTKNFLIDGKLLILRRGKHFIRVVEMVSDEEWAASGLTYPGEPGMGRVRLLRTALRKAMGDNSIKMHSPEQRKKLLDGAETIYAEQLNAGKFKELEKGVPPNRARQILKHAFSYYQEEGPRSAKLKTMAIDEVLASARVDLEALEKDTTVSNDITPAPKSGQSGKRASFTRIKTDYV